MELDLPEIDQKKIREIKLKQQESIYKDRELSSFIEYNKLSAFEVYDNLNSFVKTYESRKMCEFCPGVAKCHTKGYQIDIKYERGIISNEINQCKKRKEGALIKRKFVLYDFKNDYLYINLKDCLANFANQRKEVISNMANKIKNNDFSKGIYLYGDSGVGKSYIMHAFANTIAKKDLGMMCYINFIEIMNDLVNDSFKDRTTFDEEMELLKTIPFLFIDNFGEENKTDYSKSNIVLSILNERENNNLPTFFTSIYSLNQLKEAYKTPKTLYSNTFEIKKYIENNCDSFQLIQMKYPK